MVDALLLQKRRANNISFLEFHTIVDFFRLVDFNRPPSAVDKLVVQIFNRLVNMFERLSDSCLAAFTARGL